MIQITPNIAIADEEVQMNAIRAQGAGGQNVNKVASAVHLRFDITASSLPDPVKERLMALNDQRINDAGVLVIKAQRFRTREKNISDALERLRTLVKSSLQPPRKRVKTRPTRASKERRLESKARKSQIKQLRGRIL